MKKIVAFGASNSTKSINKELASWTARQAGDVQVDVLDLNDFEMPIFSVERQQKDGIAEEAVLFKKLLTEADGIIISFAEYNGSYTAAFKNILDWMSRIGKPIWPEVPMFLLATSPGGRGGKNVLSTALRTFPFQGANVVANFSLPSFRENFDPQEGILDGDLGVEFNNQMEKFKKSLSSQQIDAVPSV